MERFGGGLGVGLVWFHRWKRTTLRMNRSGVVYLAAIKVLRWAADTRSR